MEDKNSFHYYNKLEQMTDENGYHYIQVQLSENTMNPWGTPHGGLLFAICDEAAGSVVVDATNKRWVTLTSSIQFLRTTTSGKLTAKGHLIKLGRTVAASEADVYDDQNRHIAHAIFEFYKIDE